MLAIKNLNELLRNDVKKKLCMVLMLRKTKQCIMENNL